MVGLFPSEKSPFLLTKISTSKHIQSKQTNAGTFLLYTSMLHVHMYRWEDEWHIDLPDMVFDHNSLHIEHETGWGIEFNALDALKCMMGYEDRSIQVTYASHWQQKR
jgi:hypothetical protein